MKLSIIGTGYVGLTTGACFAEVGHDVTCVDNDEAKVALLKAGGMPIYEPGLEELVQRNVAAGRLRFTTSVAEGVERALVIFIAVPTPPLPDGSVDLSFIEKVAREIAEAGAGVTTFTDWWAYKMEAYDAIPFNAALLVRKGVLVSLNSDDAELMRHLNQEAAKTVKYGGLTEDEALALITINAARQLGIEKRVGSIEPGKDADLVIFDKHPLSNYAKVLRVMIDGEFYFDRDRDMSLRAEREIRKKALLERAREREKKQTPAARRRPS